jgi:hypothetical protein
MANKSDRPDIGLDLESCDFSEGVFFERRFLHWLPGGGLTVFQEGIIVALMALAILVSSLLAFVVIRAGAITSVSSILVWLFGGLVIGLAWSRRIDSANRDMKKTQFQYVVDSHHARRSRGHWVNGRRAKNTPPSRFFLTVESLHTRKGGRS